MIKQQSIGKANAIRLAKTQWWLRQEPRDIVKFQLFTKELAMPFDIFHENLEIVLGRPVFTHELALNFDSICLEFHGEKDVPTLEEILNLIPEEKRLVITI